MLKVDRLEDNIKAWYNHVQLFQTTKIRNALYLFLQLKLFIGILKHIQHDVFKINWSSKCPLSCI